MSDLSKITDNELYAELARRREQGEVAKRDRALGLAREMILAASGFTCIHDRVDGHPMKWNPYCTDCPVDPLCQGDRREPLVMICGRTRNYSQ